MLVTYLEASLFFVAMAAALVGCGVLSDRCTAHNIKNGDLFSNEFWDGRYNDIKMLRVVLVVSLLCLGVLSYQYLSTRPGQFDQTYVPTASCECK